MKQLAALILACIFTAGLIGMSSAQSTKSVNAPMTLTVDGRAVPLTGEERAAIAKAVPAIRAALPPADQAVVDFSAALTADQRAVVGADTAEQWTPTALITRWRSGGAPIPRATAARDLEIALVAQSLVGQPR